MNRTARKIIQLATGAHNEMQIDPVAGKRAIETALTQIEQERAGAARSDVAGFCDQATNYLQSMSRHGKYNTVFAGTLTTLNRAGELLREDLGDVQAGV